VAGVLRALKRLLGRASSTNKNPGSSPWSERVEGFIPREEFLRMIERDEVFKRMRGRKAYLTGSGGCLRGMLLL